MRFKERVHPEAHLDITPIVDTVFNLLIFFALSLNFIVTPGIKVDLPESTTEELVREREEVIVVMKRDGTLFVNSRTVTSDELFSTLTRHVQQNKDALAIIHADQEVAHGRVVRVMDMAKKAGFTRLAIATTTKENFSQGGSDVVSP